MQKIFLVLLLNSILFAARSQTSSTRIPDDSVMSSPDTISKVFIKIGMPSQDELIPCKINFSGVRFSDNRFDTSSIAYYYNGSAFEKINFKNNLPAVLNEYVNTTFKNSFIENKDSLLVLIDFLRISSGRYDLPFNNANKLIKIKLVFIKKTFNQIFILGNFDTTLLYKRKTYKDEYADCVKKTLRTALLKADELYDKKNTSEEIITENTFLQKYLNNLNLPILKDTILKKGVYRNFNEVIANSPYYLNYELGESNYIHNPGDPNNIDYRWKYFWGYCDGKTIFISTSEGFLSLIRDGNSLVISLKNPDIKAAKKSAQVANGFLLLFSILTHSSPSGAVGYNISPPKIYEKIGKKEYEITGAEINMQTGEIDF